MKKILLTGLLLLSSPVLMISNAANAKEVFSLYEVNKHIEAFASKELKLESIKLKYSKVQRNGSNRSFNIDEVKRLKIADQYFISEFSADPENKSINATLKQDEGENLILYNSKYELGVRAPVLIEAVRKGEIIEQENIEFKYFAEKKLHKNIITDITKLIGNTARRNLKSGNLVSKSSVKLKDFDLVKKNKTITVAFLTKNLELKSKAIALENGELGDIIRLKNVDSGKTFEAEVIEKNFAVVGNRKDTNSIAALRKKENNNINNL